MSLSHFVRDSFWGRVIYHFSGHKVFSYKEEQPDYVVPEKYTLEYQRHVREKEDLDDGTSSSDADPDVLTAADGRIIVTWDGDDDPENPKNWKVWQKAIFTAQVCFLTNSVYMASAIYTPGIEDIMRDLETTRVKATLPLTLFVIGCGIGPMAFSPMSENAIFGRTYIYIFTLFMFFILQIPCALVNDIASLSVLRFLSGVFASPALATGGASMGDIVSPAYLPLLIAGWGISAVCGPTLGPLFGSIMVVKRNWHWTFWFVAMVSGSCFVILSWFLPETYEKTLLLRKAKRLRKLTGNPNITSPGEIENEGLNAKDLAIEILWRPIEITIFEPIVLAIDVYISLVYSVLYSWFEAYPIAFIEVHHFAMIPFGVSFIAVTVGVSIGSLCFMLYVYRKITVPSLKGEIIYPEVFLPAMIGGAIFMPIGLFIFAWTASPNIHWFPPLLGGAIFGVSGFIVFQSAFNYLGASFYHYLASVFAGNDLFRSSLGGCFPLFATALFKNLGSEEFPVGWGTSVIAFIAVAMISIPVVFYIKGPKLRARSKYSSVGKA